MSLESNIMISISTITAVCLHKIYSASQVVSEDELPSAKKEGKESRKRVKPEGSEEKGDYDPQSPTSESESASKKLAVAKVCTVDLCLLFTECHSGI